MIRSLIILLVLILFQRVGVDWPWYPAFLTVCVLQLRDPQDSLLIAALSGLLFDLIFLFALGSSSLVNLILVALIVLSSRWLEQIRRLTVPVFSVMLYVGLSLVHGEELHLWSVLACAVLAVVFDFVRRFIIPDTDVRLRSIDRRY